MNAIKTVIVLLLVTVSLSHGQMWENESTLKIDTLKIAYKEILKNESYQAEKLSWNKKRIIGTALMISFGALAFYYHKKADDSYSKYLESGHIPTMKNYFKNTQRFDRYKGYAFIGIEIGFALNVWSFYK